MILNQIKQIPENSIIKVTWHDPTVYRSHTFKDTKLIKQTSIGMFAGIIKVKETDLICLRLVQTFDDETDRGDFIDIPISIISEIILYRKNKILS